MPAYHFPILVWEDHDGGFTATLVDGHIDASAVSTSAGEALDQIKEYLNWLYRQQPWLGEPELSHARLLHIKVDVRPEYAVQMQETVHRREPRTRVYACEEQVSLRVACVCGTDASGLLVCAMPLLGERFTYYEPESLKGLVAHYVQAALKGITPSALARRLPPKSVVLEEIVVQGPRQQSRGRQETVTTPALANIAEPLGARGVRRQLSRPWERDAEVNRVVTLVLKEKANVLLVGEIGSGKTSVLADAVRKLEREKPKDEEADEESENVRGANRFWLTSAARLIAGMQYLGQWQQRCEQVIENLSTIDGVLCIENLLDLLRTGGEGAGDSLAAFFMPYLQRGELGLIGEATPAELDACRRLLPGFAELFQIVNLAPFTRAQAISALSQVAQTQSKNLRVSMEAGIVENAYRLFARFMPYQGFPGRSSSFVMNLFDRALRAKNPSVTNAQVIAQFIQQTGLPELFLRDELPLTRDEVLTSLRQQVIGQESACESAAELILTFKSALNDPLRPIGVLLFCGPTGVGKTELAKAISNFLFGHGKQKDRLIRLDMSEYSGPGAADRLLGARQAMYSMRGEPSALIRQIRQQPFSVVLLDEIEKAAPEVFDVLLGVFDEGRLTDPYGRLTTFRSSIIIMTSNLGASRPQAFGLSKLTAPAYSSEAMSFFRPEFFNRIDAVIDFAPLSPEVMRQITEKELRDLAQREGFARVNVRLQWSDRLVQHLARIGYDIRYGARPLQRAIETLVVAPVAKYLLAHPEVRNCELAMDWDGTSLKIDAVGSAPRTASSNPP